MKKILLLGTYPINKPFHGGQLRSKAIFELYQEFANVRYCAIYSSEAFRKAGKNDIAVGADTLARISSSPYLEDIICGQALIRDQQVRNKFCSLVEVFQPDIIQLEQCYLWLGLKELIKTMPLLGECRLIYSSQNVEHLMKQETYTSLNISDDEKKQYLDLLFNAEKGLSEKSDLVIVTSDDDKRKLEQFKVHDFVVAPNGISNKPASEAAIKYWKNRFRREDVSSALVFVGSEHIPNLQGFNNLVSDRIGFLPPEARIYVVGGVCDLLQEQISAKRLQDVVFGKRISLLGKISQDKLAGLICASDIILLPINQGGGSNLKTAEAILSGKKVVATTKAFRSFDDYIDSGNIVIANNEESFKSAVLRQLDAPNPVPTPEQRRKAESVTWEKCLIPLKKAVQGVL